MKGYMKEVLAILVIGIVVAVSSLWDENLRFLPWKPFSTFLLFAIVPLLGGALYLRRLQHDKKVSYPLLSWAAIYWSTLFVLLAFIAGLMRGLRH